MIAAESSWSRIWLCMRFILFAILSLLNSHQILYLVYRILPGIRLMCWMYLYFEISLTSWINFMFLHSLCCHLVRRTLNQKRNGVHCSVFRRETKKPTMTAAIIVGMIFVKWFLSAVEYQSSYYLQKNRFGAWSSATSVGQRNAKLLILLVDLKLFVESTSRLVFLCLNGCASHNLLGPVIRSECHWSPIWFCSLGVTSNRMNAKFLKHVKVWII